MDKQMIHYCFTLSEEQMEHLRSKKYKIDRMECFVSLVVLAEHEKKLLPLSKTQQVEILPGQLMVDNTQLAKLWNKDRKTVPKILEAMEALGISSSQKIGENRIHTLHSLSGWYVNGYFRGNDFALKRNADRTAIIHADVPPARVITIEDSDDRNKGKEVSDLGSDKSPDENVGMDSPANCNVSQPSPQSNDNGNVGKSGTDGNTSYSHQDNSSHQSAGIPSSHVEADGSQNEGKRKDEPSEQHEVQSTQPNSIPLMGNEGFNQKPDGNYNPNGFRNSK